MSAVRLKISRVWAQWLEPTFKFAGPSKSTDTCNQANFQPMYSLICLEGWSKRILVFYRTVFSQGLPQFFHFYNLRVASLLLLPRLTTNCRNEKIGAAPARKPFYKTSKFFLLTLLDILNYTWAENWHDCMYQYFLVGLETWLLKICLFYIMVHSLLYTFSAFFTAILGFWH